MSPFVLFVIFVFGAVSLGAGAMLAPAWPTAQPRIGLNAALALGLILGGALFLAMLFGWDTLMLDYMLFALVTGIFLFGTLSYGQKRAEAKGETLSDTAQGWPGGRDLLFFGLVALVFILPTLILPAPLDTDAQGFGYLALTVRLGHTFDTLAPFHANISYLYAPGFSALTAYLSQQLHQPMPVVQFGAAAVLGILMIWLAYDLGAELSGKRLGRAMAVAMLCGVGLFAAYIDSHYTTLLGLVFALAFIIYALRYWCHGLLPDAAAAGVMLGCVMLSHPDTTIILALGYVPWLLTQWLVKPRPSLRRWLVLALGVPLIALVGLIPWLLRIGPLLGSDIASPFSRDPSYWRVMIFYHGVWIAPTAVIGAVVGWKQRTPMIRQAVILSVGWLALALDFSTTGILAQIAPGLMAPVLRYDYPFSLAWHGPIIPYAILGGIGLLWLWDRLLQQPTRARLARYSVPAMVGLIVVVLAMAVFNQPLLAASKTHLSFYGAFSSWADIQAMNWLRENTPPEARVLNFPGPQEGDWVPVISERDSVYYRPQPFFRGVEDSLAEQMRLRAFWEDPANPANADLLRQSRIAYVIVPQVVTDPASFQTMFRWHTPFTTQLVMRSRVADAPYLRQVFDDHGAQVYQVAATDQTALK